MIKKLSPVEKMLILSIAFTMTLLLVRVKYTHDSIYMFYIWNTFLAILPLVFSKILTGQKKMNLLSFFLLIAWLLFYPNAPYIITDVFHYEQRLPVPMWYDLMLVISAAWNGLVLGMVSLMQVEGFLSKHFKPLLVKFFVFISFGLCGYGVYIGRYLRYNTWDVVAQPKLLIKSSALQVLHPHRNIDVWAFTALFAAMFCIIYFTVKQFQVSKLSISREK